MMKRRLRLAIAAAAAIAAIVAVYAWLHNSTPPQGGPVRIEVDASRLPASCEVLGTRVTLQPVSRYGKRVQLNWSLEGGSTPIETDDTKVFFNGKEFSSRLYDTDYCWKNLYCADISTDIKLPSGTKYFDLSQEFYIKTNSKNVRFKFINLNPHRLPVKKRIGSATVTMRSISLGKLTDSPGSMSQGTWRMSQPTFDEVPKNKQFVVVQADVNVPGIREFEGEVTGTPNGSESSWTGGEQYYHINESNPTMRAGGRSMVAAVAYKFDTVSNVEEVFLREADVRTIPERVIGVVSRKSAYKMVTRRAVNAANAANLNTHYSVWLAFPTNGSIPKHISFETSVRLPADASEKAVVVFRNAPIK